MFPVLWYGSRKYRPGRAFQRNYGFSHDERGIGRRLAHPNRWGTVGGQGGIRLALPAGIGAVDVGSAVAWFGRTRLRKCALQSDSLRARILSSSPILYALRGIPAKLLMSESSYGS